MTRIAIIPALLAALILLPAAASASNLFAPLVPQSQTSFFGPQADPLNTSGTCQSGTGGNFNSTLSGGNAPPPAPSAPSAPANGGVLNELAGNSLDSICYLMGGYFAQTCHAEYWMEIANDWTSGSLQVGFGYQMFEY